MTNNQVYVLTIFDKRICRFFRHLGYSISFNSSCHQGMWEERHIESLKKSSFTVTKYFHQFQERKTPVVLLVYILVP